MTAETRGWLLGLVGVAIFSLSLPATRAAIPALDGAFIGFGRVALAAVLAAIALVALGARRPRGAEWRDLAIVALGVVFGFPVLSSMALETVPASHGAVVIGLLTLATSAWAVVLTRERPSAAFWLVGVAGAATVAVFAALRGGGSIHAGDLLLLGATILGGLGYAAGARLTPALGAGQTICWALIVSAPIALPFALWRAPADLGALPWQAWAGFLYVTAFSQVIGFFAWYRGLALGGIARVSQVQMLQPFLTILFSALLLGEALDATTLGFAALVVALVMLGRKTRIARR